MISLHNPKFLPTLFLIIGVFALSRAYIFAHQYELQTEFSYTILIFFLIGVIKSILLVKHLNTRNNPKDKLSASSWKEFRGPYSIKLILFLIMASSFILHIVFTYERFLRDGAWESWYENPSRLDSLILATSTFKTATGVLWGMVGGTELIWWLKKGRSTEDENIPP